VKDKKERREISRRSFQIYFLLDCLFLRLGYFGQQVIQGHIGKKDFAFLGVINILAMRCPLPRQAVCPNLPIEAESTPVP
jgi:hypothetical protein